MYTFHIKGSAAQPYEVTIGVEGGSLFAVCTCPAGARSQLCKHLFGVLDGKANGIVSDNADDVEKIPAMLNSTPTAQLLQDYLAAEQQAADAKKRAASLKKQLARQLYA